MKRGIDNILIGILVMLALVFASYQPHAMDKVNSDLYKEFGDVHHHIAKKTISKWQSNKVIMGYQGNFRPDDLITRAELASLLNRVILSSKTGDAKFSDMDEKAWYYKDMMSLYYLGILTAKSGKLNPQGYVGYEDVEEIFSRAFDMQKKWNPSKKEGFLTRAQAVLLLDEKIAGFYFKQGNYKGKIRGNVVVNTSNVKLSNMKIDGNLYIMDGVGDGDIHLENVKVSGKILVKGGGPRSVHIDNCEINELVSMKDEVRIVFTNGTTVSFLRSQVDDGILEFKDAKIGNMTILGDGLQVKLESSSVANLNVEANKIKIDADVNSAMNVVNLNGQANITGKGKITEAIVNKNGSVIETKPKKVVANNGVSVEIANAASNSQSGGTGSSSADDYEPYNPPTPPVEPPTPPVTPPNPPVEEEIFASHSVANKVNIPYNTEFEALDMPTEADLTSTKANIVKVNLLWAKEDYDGKKPGEQILKASVSAKTGELPNWAPGEIQVKVNVKMPPLPKKLVIYKILTENEITKDEIMKGDKGSYYFRVYDDNDNLMSKKKLEECGASVRIDEIENIYAKVKLDTSLMEVRVPEDYEEDQFTLTLNFEYTLLSGGSLSKTLIIDVKDGPSGILPPVDLSIEMSGELEEKGYISYRFTEPDDITPIHHYELSLVKAGSEDEIDLGVFMLAQEAGEGRSDYIRPDYLPDDAFSSDNEYHLKLTSCNMAGNLRASVIDTNDKIKFVKDEDFRGIEIRQSTWTADPDGPYLRLSPFMYSYYSGEISDEMFLIEAQYDNGPVMSEYGWMEDGELQGSVMFFFIGEEVDFTNPGNFRVSIQRVHPLEEVGTDPVTGVKLYRYRCAPSLGLEIGSITIEE